MRSSRCPEAIARVRVLGDLQDHRGEAVVGQPVIMLEVALVLLLDHQPDTRLLELAHENTDALAPALDECIDLIVRHGPGKRPTYEGL